MKQEAAGKVGSWLEPWANCKNTCWAYIWVAGSEVYNTWNCATD